MASTTGDDATGRFGTWGGLLAAAALGSADTEVPRAGSGTEGYPAGLTEADASGPE